VTTTPLLCYFHNLLYEGLDVLESEAIVFNFLTLVLEVLPDECAIRKFGIPVEIGRGEASVQELSIRRVPSRALSLVSPHSVCATCCTDLEADIPSIAILDCGFKELLHLLELAQRQGVTPPVKYRELIAYGAHIEDLVSGPTLVLHPAEVTEIVEVCFLKLADASVDVIENLLCIVFHVVPSFLVDLPSSVQRGHPL